MKYTGRGQKNRRKSNSEGGTMSGGRSRECSRFSIRPLPDNRVEEAIDEIGRLDHLKEATEIIAAVS